MPVNATWAQKPEEKKETRNVVKTDEDAPDAIALTAVDDALPELTTSVVLPELTTRVVTAVETAEPGQFTVVVNADGSPWVVAAGSLDEAVDKLKDQIKEISKKSHQSDQDRARQKALERALKEIEKLAKHTGAKLEQAKRKEERREIVTRPIIVSPLQSAAMSPETKAEIAKARARIEELTDDLHSKQKELMEARSRLSKLLTAATHAAGAVVRLKPEVEKRNTRLRELPAATGEPRYTVRRDADTSQKRLDELEKKLEKLLEEVAALKKDRAN